MSTSLRTLVVSAGVAGSLVSGSSLAEPYGLLNGRTADTTGISDMAIQFGALYINDPGFGGGDRHYLD